MLAPPPPPPPLLLLLLLAAAAGLAQLQLAGALENGLARTPPMAWLAWTRFGCQVDCQRFPDDCIDARLFKQMADRLAADGWRALGYDTVHIDDCWSELRRNPSSGRLEPDRRRFPAGMGELASHVHQHGLKLGLYGDCGTATCAGYPAQLRHNDTLAVLRRRRPPLGAGAESEAESEAEGEAEGEAEFIRTEATFFQLDAQTLADWRVDSLKFDGCHVEPLRAELVCSKMAGALEASGRPILLICEWPFYMMYAHAEPDFNLTKTSCNVWRYYDDIDDSWLSILNTIDYTVRHQATILKHHGPGHWFDPDQLVIGNFGLSVAQARAQMAIWCVWSAPLYMSNDLRDIEPQMAAILKSRNLIAVDQDKLGVFGQMVAQKEGGLLQAFVKPILPVSKGCPSFAVVLLNRKTMGNRQKVSFKVADLLLPAAPIRQAAANQAAVRAFEARRRAAEAGPWDWEEAVLERLFEDAATRAAPREGANGQEEALIQPDECLQRLRRAIQPAERDGANDDADETAAQGTITFELEDLMDPEEAGARPLLSASGSLELLVGPSNVRAVKLLERLPPVGALD